MPLRLALTGTRPVTARGLYRRPGGDGAPRPGLDLAATPSASLRLRFVTGAKRLHAGLSGASDVLDGPIDCLDAVGSGAMVPESLLPGWDWPWQILRARPDPQGVFLLHGGPSVAVGALPLRDADGWLRSPNITRLRSL